MEPSLNEHVSVGGDMLVLQVRLQALGPVPVVHWIESPAPRLRGLALQFPHQQNGEKVIPTS